MDLLAEIAVGRRIDSVEAAPEVDPVQVKLEHFPLHLSAVLGLLKQEFLDPVRQERFGHFAADAAILELKRIACELLGDGARSLGHFPCLNVEDDRPNDPDLVHSVMGVKTLVFRGDEGVDQGFRDFCDAHRLAVLHENASQLRPVPVINNACDLQFLEL